MQCEEQRLIEMISSYSLFGAFLMFILVDEIYFVSWCWKPQGHLTPPFGPSCLISDQFLSMDPGYMLSQTFFHLISPRLVYNVLASQIEQLRLRTVPQCPSLVVEQGSKPRGLSWTPNLMLKWREVEEQRGWGVARRERKAKRYRKLLQKHHWQIEGNYCDIPITHSHRLCKNLKKYVSNYGKHLCAIIHKYPESLH